MRKYQMIFFGTIALISSCDNAVKSTKPNLAGQVYIVGSKIDSAKCEIIPEEIDYSESILFLNDSEFVHIINTCCGELNEDFPFDFYNKGTYKMDNEQISLIYAPTDVIVYRHLYMNNPEDGTVLDSSRVAIEKSERKNKKMKVLYCKTIPYFESKEDDAIYFFAPDNLRRTVGDIKNIPGDSSVWQKLNSKK